MLSGREIFFFEPGLKDDVFCLVCGAKCEVRRNVYGATGSAMAMVKKKIRHDQFKCPNVGIDWHEQAAALQEEIQNTASKRLAAILNKDLEDLLAEQNP